MEEREKALYKVVRNTGSAMTSYGNATKYTVGSVSDSEYRNMQRDTQKQFAAPQGGKIESGSLLVTEKRLLFVTNGHLVTQIFTDPKLAGEKFRRLGSKNREPVQKFTDEYSKLSGWGKMTRRPSAYNFGFVGTGVMLLKNAERSNRILHGTEVNLDLEEFSPHVDLVREGLTSGKWTSRLHKEKEGGMHGGHLTFTDIDSLADKLIAVLQPNLAAMSEYIESEQPSKDYESGILQPVDLSVATEPHKADEEKKKSSIMLTCPQCGWTGSSIQAKEVVSKLKGLSYQCPTCGATNDAWKMSHKYYETNS